VGFSLFGAPDFSFGYFLTHLAQLQKTAITRAPRSLGGKASPKKPNKKDAARLSVARSKEQGKRRKRRVFTASVGTF
jgi:hypothetical protein